MKRTTYITRLILIVLGFASLSIKHRIFAQSSSIVRIFTPVGSNDSASHPLDDNVWSVEAVPGSTATSPIGIGWIVHPELLPNNTGFESNEHDFSKADHHYTDTTSGIPDASRSVVTYQFDNSATVVSKLKVIEHRNGITEVEGFAGDDLGALVSVGKVTGDAVLHFNGFGEEAPNTFTFPTPRAGKYFQFVVTRTFYNLGYGFYRAFVEDAGGNPYTAAAPLVVASAPPCEQALAAANAQITQLLNQLLATQTANQSLQSQVNVLAFQNSQLQSQLNAVAQQSQALSQSLGQVFNNPSFKIPGNTPQQQIQNLVSAIGQLNHGQQQALYKNLGGK